jgi:excisionase family DNA binding protein
VTQRIDPYTTTELAQAAGVTDAYIRKLCIAGKLTGRKMGRDWAIPAEEAKRFIADRRKRFDNAFNR